MQFSTNRDVQAHPWVTKNGKDPLLSEEENTANLVEPPTEEETDQAITGNLGNVLSLVSRGCEILIVVELTIFYR